MDILRKEDLTAIQIPQLPVDISGICKAEAAYFQPIVDALIQDMIDRKADEGPE